MTPTDAALPLAGITVVALEQAVAGPLATRHLADLGARVVKIERPGEGDFASSSGSASTDRPCAGRTPGWWWSTSPDTARAARAGTARPTTRFATNIERVRHRAECDELVTSYTSRWTTEELDDRLAQVGISAAQINTTAALVEHPQLAERDRWRPVATEAGEIRGVLPPMTFRDVELPMGAVPALGEHTAAILAELGLATGD